MRPRKRAKGPTTADVVPAVTGIIDHGVGDANVAESLIDVGVRYGRRANVCNLAGQWVGSTQAVDLADVRCAKCFEHNLLSFFDVLRKIVLQKENRFASSVSIHRALNFYNRSPNVWVSGI